MKACKLNLLTNADGTVALTAELDRSAVNEARKLYDDLHGSDLNLEVKKWYPRRSLDSNGYFWALCGKVAENMGINKTEVYREAIRDIGGNSETVCVLDQAVDKLCGGWKHNGLGWITETSPSKLAGCTNVTLYYGSSTYDVKQMHALIDHIVQDAKALGIETMTPAELAALEEQWANRTIKKSASSAGDATD